MEELRLPFDEIKIVLQEILQQHGFDSTKAERLAHVHTSSSLDGVYSHGLNRFPVFIEFVQKGFVLPESEPERFNRFGSMEQWDGNLGSGVWNASTCMERAIEIARGQGMSLVTLRNTNHWMRGGTYGWQAADAGMIGLCFTNTKPNMPPWGGKESRIGNNPLVIALPRPGGAHVVLDMSMSQFSFGKINQYLLEGKKLPFPGGWDEEGQLSDDPETILKKERGLPMGYWKGSALSIMLDAMAAMLALGRSTYQIGLSEVETGVSQIFLCINPDVLGTPDAREKMLGEMADNIHHVDPFSPDHKTRVPGENTLEIRRENLEAGIPVDRSIWEKILQFSR